jgi:hypothetical protein
MANQLTGTLVVTGGRVVAFTPAVPFSPSTYYRLEVKGGSSGARRASGNWFPTDQRARWRTGTEADTQAPVVSATVNGIQQSRLPGVTVPNYGFTIDVSASDNTSQWVDMGTVEVTFQGNGTAPGASTLLATGSFTYNSVRIEVPETAALTDGVWNMTVTVRDLSGNAGSSSPVALTVAAPTGRALPFERTQVVWVRTDLDRIGGGMPDFDGDLLLLGLTTAGDPIGTNAWMRNLVLNGILAKSNHLYGRGSRGEPLDAGSVGLRFTKREPIGLPHMQIALGGLDPEGSRTRVYGDDSTGVLGRAYYDYCNGNPSERNISTSPGLGVFCREMWLYQAKIHLQVWPSWQTSFAAEVPAAEPRHGRHSGRRARTRLHRAVIELRLWRGHDGAARALAGRHGRGRRLGLGHGHHPRARSRSLGRPRRARRGAGRTLWRLVAARHVLGSHGRHGALGRLRVDDHARLPVPRPRSRLPAPQGTAPMNRFSPMKNGICTVAASFLWFAVPAAAQEQATALSTAARAAAVVVRATVVVATDPSPEWHRLQFRTSEVLKGTVGGSFALLEPSGACCGRSLFALQPGQSCLLFLRQIGAVLHPFGGSRGVLPDEPEIVLTCAPCCRPATTRRWRACSRAT